MKYTYKRKSVEKSEKSDVQRRNRKKAAYLALWGLAALTLYLVFSKYFAVTTVQVIEVLVLGSLLIYCALLVTTAELKKEIQGAASDKGTDKSENEENEEKKKKLEKLVSFSKGLIIFVIPLIFILIFDFIVSTLLMFGSPHAFGGLGKLKR